MLTKNSKAEPKNKPAPKQVPSNAAFYWIFLKMGCMAFGGWSTTVLLIEKKFINELGLLSKKQLQNAIASGQVIPGAAQVIVAVQAAYYICRIRGAISAAVAYLLPSIVLTLGFSFMYFSFIGDSDFSSHTLGLQAAVGGIILGNAYRIGKSNISNTWLWLAVVPALVATLILHIPTIYTIFCYAVIGIFIGQHKRGLSRE